MLEVRSSKTECVLTSWRLQLRFVLCGDRWQHSVALATEGEVQTWLTSLEGMPDQFVPPSPVFQDLRLERIDDWTQEVQLFGQCGKLAYSAAVRFLATTQQIDFDVCARLSGLGECRGVSSYQPAPGTPAPSVVLSPPLITWPMLGCELQPYSPSVDQPVVCGTLADTGALEIASATAAARTARWGYRFTG